jgi:hypothetical protein
MRSSVAVVCVMLASTLISLSGCERPGSDTIPADTVQVDAIRPGLLWTLQLREGGAALLLTDPSGESLLQLSCREEPRMMTVDVERFEPVSSEDRLSFGAGGEPFVFVADLADTTASGVRAHAPASEEFLMHLRRANQVSAVYGAQTLGPHIPPDSIDTERFIDSCGGRGSAL